MDTKFIARRFGRAFVALAIGVTLAAAPYALDPAGPSFAGKLAFAKGGNGGGNGNGPGGGNGNGNGNGSGSGNGNGGNASAAGSNGGKGGDAGVAAAAPDAKGAALGHAKADQSMGSAPAKGLAKTENSLTTPAATSAHMSANSYGVTASSLGRLNAAHASLNGLSHASPSSTVGTLASYAAALSGPEITQSDIEAAGTALAAAANKSIDLEVVQAVNGLLGVEVAPDVAMAVADHAAAVQSGTVAAP